MDNNIKIITRNGRGFFLYLIRENIDIGLVCETWLNDETIMKHPNYFCYREDGSNLKRGGDVANAIRKNLKRDLIYTLQTKLIENIGIQSYISDNFFINIYSCYFPGGTAGSNDLKKN